MYTTHDKTPQELKTSNYGRKKTSERDPLVKKTSEKEGWTARLFFLITTINIGGFLIGFQGSVLNPILRDIWIDARFESSFEQGLLVSMSAVGGLLGAGLGAKSTDVIGRKNTIILSDAVMGLGSIMVLFGVVSKYLILVSRFIVGIGVGLAGMSIPIYLTEISPAAIRGGAMAIHAVSQNVGQLFAIAISCVIFAENLRKHLYWRWVIALSSVPAFLHMFMLFWYPKSPRWLIQKNKTHQAIGVLTQILGIDEDKARYRAVGIAKTYRQISQPNLNLWQNLFRSSAFRQAVLIGTSLAFFQQLSGINTIMNYSTTILENTGLTSTANGAVYLSLPVVGLQLIAGIFSIRVIDHWGRKPLLIWSFVAAIFALLVMTSSSYILQFQHNPHILQYQWLIPVAEYGSLVGMLFYIIAYAPGLGPVPAAINSEIFPTRHRGLGGALFVMMTWLSSSIVTTVFPMISATAGMGTAFFISMLGSIIGLIFVHFKVFETKGQDLEKIMRNFSRAQLQPSRHHSIQT